MKINHLSNMVRGWIVGKFSPSLYYKDYEIGFKYYKKGDYEKSHAHLLSDEVTIVLFGNVEMNGKQYSEGDIIIQEKGEFTDFLCISDKAITAVYRPDGSFTSDKIFNDTE
jgi:hypothetical protein